jgi:hypothetical protein
MWSEVLIFRGQPKTAELSRDCYRTLSDTFHAHPVNSHVAIESRSGLPLRFGSRAGSHTKSIGNVVDVVAARPNLLILVLVRAFTGVKSCTKKVLVP